LKRVFQKHLDDVKAWLARNEAFEVVYIDHHDLVTNPAQAVEQVNAFLGGGLDTAAMLKMVDPSLYRERAST
jgi:hypothetical protein